jgi:hypothetical protein
MIQILIADGGNPSALGGYACTRVCTRVASDVWDLIELLHEFSCIHTNFHKYILVIGNIDQLVRWWIVPCRNSAYYVASKRIWILEPSLNEWL